MAKTNKFRVKDFEENKITIEEERKNRSVIALFFARNGRLIFWISLLFSLTVFIIAIYLALTNIEESSIVKYESNGVVVSFDKSDDSILNGTPITRDYATKVFDNVIEVSDKETGVVIKVKEIVLQDRIIVFYSDKSILIKYKDGRYLKVYPVNSEYGVKDDGIINRGATTKNVSGNIKINNNLGISLLYLSDGSIEVTKDNSTFLVRNSDITSNNDIFYTNLSGVSVPINISSDKVYYSDGTIIDNNTLIVDNNRYEIKEEKDIFDNIKIIYYTNGYALVVKDNLSIMIRDSNHIIYNDSTLEIIDNTTTNIDINDIMDIKDIKLNNNNNESIHYMIVLEETNNYNKYNITNILDNNYINYNIYVNGEKYYNNILNNNLKNKNKLEGLSLNNNTYLLYEGNIDKLSSINIKLGLWIDYENITNEYMNSSFIGTIKVYIDSLS